MRLVLVKPPLPHIRGNPENRFNPLWHPLSRSIMAERGVHTISHFSTHHESARWGLPPPHGQINGHKSQNRPSLLVRALVMSWLVVAALILSTQESLNIMIRH